MRVAQNALAQNAARDEEIEREGRRFEHRECHKIRQTGECGAKHQKDGRIIKEIVFYTRFGDALLGGVMLDFVVGELRSARVRQAAGGIKADKIGRRRLFERNDEAVGASDEKQKKRDFDRQQDPTSGSEASAVQQWRRTMSRRRTERVQSHRRSCHRWDQIKVIRLQRLSTVSAKRCRMPLGEAWPVGRSANRPGLRASTALSPNIGQTHPTGAPKAGTKETKGVKMSCCNFAAPKHRREDFR